MLLRDLHPWRVSPAEAIAIQARLAPQVIPEGGPEAVRHVAGADIARAREFVASDALRAAMERAGVVSPPEFWFTEDVEDKHY